MIGGNPKRTRKHNLSLVLNSIRERGTLSRSDLAPITRLTRTTISRIVNNLCALGIVVERGTKESTSKGGPKPVVLKINAGYAASVGVDIRREIISSVLVDLEGEFLLRKRMVLRDRSSSEVIFRQICECIDSVLTQRPKDLKILGMGVGATGPIDYTRGLVKRPVDFDGFKDVPLQKQLSEKYDCDVVVESGAAAGAFGEYFWTQGENESRRNLVFLELDLGIGYGHLLGGQPIHGYGRASGTFAHTIIRLDGEPCSCGRKGCLHQYASGVALVKRLGLLEKRNRPHDSSISDHKNYYELLESVANGAKNGDRDYRRAFGYAAKYLSVSILNLFNLINPDQIVIGSSIEGFAGVYRDYVLRALRRGVTENEKDLVDRIVPSRLGSDAIAMGAAALVLKAFYDDPLSYVKKLSTEHTASGSPEPPSLHKNRAKSGSSVIPG